MNLYQNKKVLIIVIFSFATYYFLFSNFKYIKVGLDTFTQHGLISYILTYFLIGTPIFIGTFLISKTINIFKSLGLSANLYTAIWTSIFFTLPMFIGGLFYFKFNSDLDFNKLIAGTIIAGFMEELYYRGFLFGQIFKNTKLGFIPSILLGAIIFAFGHLYQSQNINELIGIFMITFSGAIFFAWLYVEWNYNLWVPIFLHTFMNLSWNLFEVDSSALGDVKANIFRSLTIITAIIFTIIYKRSKSEELFVNKRTLILKNNSL